MNARLSHRRSGGRKPKTRRKRRTPEDIKERLLLAAREEFKAKGYPGATTAAIAKRAGVAEIQMFRYFPSKGDLFRHSVFGQMQDHFRKFNAEHSPGAIDEASIRERARIYTTELHAFLNDHGKLLVSLLFAQTYAVPSLESSATGLGALQAFFDDCATAMSSRAPGRSNIDAGTIVRVAFGALLGCITYRDWLFPQAAGDDTAISDAVAEFVLAGIGPHSDLGSASGKPRSAKRALTR